MSLAPSSGQTDMSKVISHLSISLDGFVAGPNQSHETPIGEGGMRLHEWHFADALSDANVPDAHAAKAMSEGAGAYIMGRNMFGPGRGAWDESWEGWWGDEPPYHTPVFVLTHHPREPVAMQGGTTFEFVSDGIEAALERARAAAGEDHVFIAGGASTVQQFLAAGHLDELHLHIAPILLHRGERLLENVGDPVLEPIYAAVSPTTTHISYRIQA